MKKITSVLICAVCTAVLAGCGGSESSQPVYTSQKTAWEAAGEKEKMSETLFASHTDTVITSVTTQPSLLSSPEDIDIRDTDGNGTEYLFTYDGEDFRAVYTPDNWKITDSYKITDMRDMIVICRALSDIHPIPDKERKGTRTPEDLAYEWNEHNKAYDMLPDDSEWKDNVKDVDLDPDDQGKSFMDMAMDRLNKKSRETS